MEAIGWRSLFTFVALSLDCIFSLLLHPPHPSKNEKQWGEPKETGVGTGLEIKVVSLLQKASKCSFVKLSNSKLRGSASSTEQIVKIII